MISHRHVGGTIRVYPTFFASLMHNCLRSSSSHLALFYTSNRTLSQPLFARINKPSPLVSTFKIGFPFSWTSQSNPFHLLSVNPFFFSPKLHILFQTRAAVTFKVPCIYQDDNQLETGLSKNLRISLKFCSYLYVHLLFFLILRGKTPIHLLWPWGQTTHYVYRQMSS